MRWYHDGFYININAFSTIPALVLLAFFLIALVCYMVIVRKSVLLYYVKALLVLMCGFMAAFFIYSNTLKPEVAFWSARWLYVFFFLYSVAAAYTISYMNPEQKKYIRRSSVVASVVMIPMILLSDRLVITREIKVSTFLVAQKGPLILLVYGYMAVYGLIFVYEAIRLYKHSREKYNELYPIYFGLIFSAFYINGIGIAIYINPYVKPRLSISTTVFCIMLIVYLFDQVKRTIIERDVLIESYLYDDLTKVYSRNYILQEIGEKANRRNQSVAHIAIVDVDGLKKVNDHYGHAAGDQLLKTFGYLLKEIRMEGFYPGRIGGDEFVLFFCGAESSEVFEILKDLLVRYNKVFENSFEGVPKSWTGLSIGFARFDEKMPIDDMLNTSDEIMYIAKKNGKNSIASNVGMAYHVK